MWFAASNYPFLVPPAISGGVHEPVRLGRFDAERFGDCLSIVALSASGQYPRQPFGQRFAI